MVFLPIFLQEIRYNYDLKLQIYKECHMKASITYLLISVISICVLNAQIEELPNYPVEEAPSQAPPAPPKNIVIDDPSYFHKDQILQLIESKDVKGFMTFIQEHEATEEMLIERNENILRHLLSEGEMTFAEPLMDFYLEKFGTKFPPSSHNGSNIMYLHRACSSCQIDLLKKGGQEMLNQVLKHDQLKTNLITGCVDEQALIDYFESINAIAELPVDTWPVNAVAAIENNRYKMIEYLVKKKNLKLESRSFHNQVNKMETLNFLWDLGMTKTGLPAGAKNVIVGLLWADANINEIKEVLASGLITKEALANERKLGKNFLLNSNTEKIKYARDLFLSLNKPIKFFRINANETEKKIFTREELKLILEMTTDTKYGNTFFRSFKKPDHFDGFVHNLVFQTCLAADKDFFDYLAKVKKMNIYEVLNQKRRTVFHIAAISGDVSFFKHLYEQYDLKELLSKDDTDYNTPLELAQKFQLTEMVNYLKSIGAK